MSTPPRRVLTASDDKAQVQKRYDEWYKDRDDTARVEQVGERWVVTAAKTKKEGR